VRQHDGVVVDVDDARLRRDALGHLVGVVRGRDARADVQELAYPGLTNHIADDAAQELPIGARDDRYVGKDSHKLIAGLAVGGVVVLPAEPVIPHPSRVGHARVDLGRLCLAGT
jgi:hypothetical protein